MPSRARGRCGGTNAMLSPEAATLLKASISDDEKQAAVKAVAAWTAEEKSKILLELINNVDLTLILPKPPKPTAADTDKDENFISSVYRVGFLAWVVSWIILGLVELG